MKPMEALLWIAVAVALDAVLGDPHWLPHPVVAVGRLISALEKFLRPRAKNLRRAGVALGLTVVLLTGGAAWALSLIHPAVQVYLLYAALAPRCMHSEARKVRRTLETGTLDEARAQLSMLVGRDTAALDAGHITKATVETVAENTTDGVISPLLWMLLGSLFGAAVPLAWAFKAASTLDSMVGYRNEKYIDFGRFSAKMDDVFNYIPARVTGVLMCLAAFFCRLDARNAWRILWRDHANHPSPNSAWAESAAAGALGLQLGGGAFYGGKWVEKKTQGDALKQPEPKDIGRVCALMWVTYAEALVVFGGIVFLLFRLGVVK
jgi:adenosylcobinamide-phosphate synthase